MSNPPRMRTGDLRERRFSGMRFALSFVAPSKKVARERAEWYRGRGVLVRIVKLSDG